MPPSPHSLRIALVAPRDRAYAAISEGLASRASVEVLATCLGPNHVHDYEDPGVFRVGEVTVRRFRNDHGSVPELVERLAARVREGGTDPDLQRRWIEERGPYSSGLLEFLSQEREAFDAFVFLGLASAPSVFGVPRVARAVLVPDLEDESVARAEVLRDCLGAAAGVVFASEEERQTLVGLVPAEVPHAVAAGSLTDAIVDVTTRVVERS